MPELPVALRCGADTIAQHLPDVTFEGPWVLQDGRWRCFCTVLSRCTSIEIASVTRWQWDVDARYPAGKIHLWPAMEGGLTATFPHQRANTAVQSSRAIRTGVPCLVGPGSGLGAWGSEEPKRDYDRLCWHAQRLLEWLECAATDRLLVTGDPFEHPDAQQTSAFSLNGHEGPGSLERWTPLFGGWGAVELVLDGRQQQQVYPLHFKQGDRQVWSPPWGPRLQNLLTRLHGRWLLLPELPVIFPWSYPRTWDELCEVAHDQGVDLQPLLQDISEAFTDRQLHPLLLGYPVPEHMGEVPKEIHWQALQLPPLATQKQHAPGWRAGANGRWRWNRQGPLAPERALQFWTSRNAAPDTWGSRGHLPEHLRQKFFAVIGCGALGSLVAESLVRMGVRQLALFDADVLLPGNLVRHTLSMREVGLPKAHTLAFHLNALSPHTSAQGYTCAFPALTEDAHAAFATAEVVLDLTAEDGVLEALGRERRDSSTDFISLSLGWRAQRLYAYAERSARFGLKGFQNRIGPEVLRDVQTADEPPREGIGCWSPVFPATHADVALLAAAACAFVREALEGSGQPSAAVFEQVQEAGIWAGIQRRPL